MTLFVAETRRVLRWLWANGLAATGCLWWARYQLRRSGAVVPLTFHRVLRDADYRTEKSPPGVVLRDRTFRALLAHVVRRFELVDLRESEPGIIRRKLRVALTFDDGWLDTYTVAFPIVREHRIPFIVFICPGLIDDVGPICPERAASLMREVRPSSETGEAAMLIANRERPGRTQSEQVRVKLSEGTTKQESPIESMDVEHRLSWAAVAEMHQSGVSFGSHSQTHPILTTVPLDRARREVRESKAAIERALSEGCDTFAYPNGNWSPEIRDMLAEAGFRLAVTTAYGAWTTASDRLAIPRLNICEDNVIGPTHRFSPTMFEYATFWKAWRATKARSVLTSYRQPVHSQSES